MITHQWPNSLRWRHNGRDGVSNHQPHDCLLNSLFGRRSKKASKFRVTGLCAGNSPGTGEFPAQMASNVENVAIWWRHLFKAGLAKMPSQSMDGYLHPTNHDRCNPYRGLISDILCRYKKSLGLIFIIKSCPVTYGIVLGIHLHIFWFYTILRHSEGTEVNGFKARLCWAYMINTMPSEKNAYRWDGYSRWDTA